MLRRLVLIGGLLAVVDAGVVMWPSKPEQIELSVVPTIERAFPGRIERAGREAGWVEAILARPLFEPGRRSPEPEAAPKAEPEIVPRLTGIIVSASTRQALFVTPNRVALGEGERLGPFTVSSIRAGAVDLAGPEGLRTIYPASDAAFRATLAGARPLMALVGAEQRETSTETDQ